MTAKIIIPSVMPCPSCSGTGMALNSYTGEPDDCKDCMDGYVRARDYKGRFVGNTTQFRTERRP
jgi:DnaJ-class molecular chaperone